MDRSTRNYAIFLAVLVLGLMALFLYQDPKVSELNQRLQGDPEIANFPFPFRVVKVHNDVATLTTPRSTLVPVVRILGILYPEVAGRAADSVEFQRAQKRLAKLQTRVRDLVLADPGIKHVSWELDRAWLSQQGIIVTP